MEPYIIKGAFSKDLRGTILHNNNLDMLEIRRMYIIQNRDTIFLRGWKAHRVEKRWFTVIKGTFTIRMVKIDNWENPSQDAEQLSFTLTSALPDVLAAPQGYATLIKSEEEDAQLLVFSDYLLGITNDEINYPPDYFSPATKY